MNGQDSLELNKGGHLSSLVEPSHREFIEKLSGGRGTRYTRVAMAALSSIPWVGGFIAAAAAFSAEHDQAKISELQRLRLEEPSRRDPFESGADPT